MPRQIPIVGSLVNVMRAVARCRAERRWVRAGSPKRSMEQVSHIFKAFCLPCEDYKEGLCTHEDGGLMVADDCTNPARNAIVMATEGCPKALWSANVPSSSEQPSPV